MLMCAKYLCIGAGLKCVWDSVAGPAVAIKGVGPCDASERARKQPGISCGEVRSCHWYMKTVDAGLYLRGAFTNNAAFLGHFGEVNLCCHVSCDGVAKTRSSIVGLAR